ncbi:hypothetical protein L873DRAFT_1629831, partial [Choiromyces venosus 120613-1]
QIRLKPDSNPPHRSQYHLILKEKEAYDKTIKQLLTKRYIHPSISPYTASIIFVSKAS